MSTKIDTNILAGLNSLIGPIEKIDIISQENNIVYFVSAKKKYILKIIKDKSSNYLLEELVCKKLNLKSFIISYKDNQDYILYEYIEGLVLADGTFDDDTSRNIIIQFFDFIDSVSNINSRKIGVLDNLFDASEKDWCVFLRGYMEKQLRKSKGIASEYSDKVKKVLTRICSESEKRNYQTIAMDLNLKNFVLSKDKKLRAIHIPVIWRGDIVASYGELASHIYNTKYWPYFLDEIKRRGIKDNYIYYMFLMSYTTLTFVSRHQKINLKQARPWGNDQATFYEIMDFCLDKIKDYD